MQINFLGFDPVLLAGCNNSGLPLITLRKCHFYKALKIKILRFVARVAAVRF